MKNRGAILINAGNIRSITPYLGQFIFKMCMEKIPLVSRTIYIWLIDIELQLTWRLCSSTLYTSITSGIPGFWRHATCSRLIISRYIITTSRLNTGYYTTPIFIISSSVDTITTLTTLITITDTIIITNYFVTCFTTIQTFPLSSTVEFSFTTKRWNTSIFF